MTTEFYSHDLKPDLRFIRNSQNGRKTIESELARQHCEPLGIKEIGM